MIQTFRWNKVKYWNWKYKTGCKTRTSKLEVHLVTSHSFHLTSCASGRGLRGLRRRCWGRPSFSPGPSASPVGAWPSVGWNWSRGLRGKNRRRKRRLLGAYRLPLTGTPPGPVTFAASEPCREKRNLSCRFRERKKSQFSPSLLQSHQTLRALRHQRCGGIS